MRTNKTIGFADLAAARRIKKEDFLTHINKIIDWRPVGNIINKNYQKGKSHTGRPAYDGLLLSKICLLQNWYNLSDYEAEERINDSLFFLHDAPKTIEDINPNAEENFTNFMDHFNDENYVEFNIWGTITRPVMKK